MNYWLVGRLTELIINIEVNLHVNLYLKTHSIHDPAFTAPANQFSKLDLNINFVTHLILQPNTHINLLSSGDDIY